MGPPWEFSLEEKDSGPLAFLEFITQRLEKRQRELGGTMKFSSHHAQLETIVQELEIVRSAYVDLMRREGWL